MNAFRRLTCWLFGHRVQSDPSRGFSYRMRVCTRCHRITPLAPIPTGKDHA